MNRLSLKMILAATLIASAAADDLVVSAAVDTFMGSADQASMVTNLGATTTGANLFKIANPGAIRFLRVNADNTVDALSAADMLTALGTSAYAPSNVAITGGSALLSASASGGATLRVPHGTAPSSPANGDLWTTSTSVFARVNGATVDLAAGLINWTEAVSSSTPNASVSAVSLAATNAATNVDATIVPKGSGALQAQVPDNASSGGNKRGAYSVDWQRVRSAASQVAVGSGAVIGGGGNNTTAQSYPTIAGGFGNTVSANYGAVAGGLNNSASGANSFVGGGESNGANAAHSVVCGGSSNTASAGNATVLGGASNTANGNYATAAGPPGAHEGHLRGIRHRQRILRSGRRRAECHLHFAPRDDRRDPDRAIDQRQHAKLHDEHHAAEQPGLQVHGASGRA